MTTPTSRKKRTSGDRAFSERLSRARSLRGLLLTDLATQSRVDKGQLSRLENGLQTRPSAEAVFSLSEVLGVRPEWLWRGIEPMEADATEKRLRELRQHLEQQDADDEVLRSALKKASGRFHATVFAVARTFALSGERHTLDGWLARFSEIETQIKPILPR